MKLHCYRHHPVCIVTKYPRYCLSRHNSRLGFEWKFNFSMCIVLGNYPSGYQGWRQRNTVSEDPRSCWRNWAVDHSVLCPCPLVQPHGRRGWLMVSPRTLIRAAAIVQCVEHLPCKHKGLCWDPQNRSWTQQFVPVNPGLGRQGLGGLWACCSVVWFKQQAWLLWESKTEMNKKLCLSAWGFIFRIKLGWSP